MNQEQLLEFAAQHNLVDEITSKLIENLAENPTMLPHLYPHTFMTKFFEDRQVPYPVYWYRSINFDLKAIPGLTVVETAHHQGLFTQEEGWGRYTTFLTEDFVFYAMNRIEMRAGYKRELAQLLTDHGFQVPFEIPDIGNPQVEDKKSALRTALLKVALAKPVAFTKVAQEEMRISGFDPKSLKKAEVLELLDEIF